MRSGWSAAISASSSGRRSSQRSARLRMLSVATSSRGIAGCLSGGSGGGRGPGRGRRRGLGGPERDGEGERRALALLGLDADPAAVALDDVPGDRQAEPRAAPTHAGAVGLVEALEDAGPVGLRDPDPVVAYGDGDDVTLAPDADHDLAALWAELHGVVDEVHEHLAQAVLVAAHERDARRHLD